MTVPDDATELWGAFSTCLESFGHVYTCPTGTAGFTRPIRSSRRACSRRPARAPGPTRTSAPPLPDQRLPRQSCTAPRRPRPTARTPTHTRADAHLNSPSVRREEAALGRIQTKDVDQVDAVRQLADEHQRPPTQRPLNEALAEQQADQESRCRQRIETDAQVRDRRFLRRACGMEKVDDQQKGRE